MMLVGFICKVAGGWVAREQALVSLRQSILCGYDDVTFLWGMPDMPHSFCCEATDWLRGIWSFCKRVGVIVVVLVGASVVQILKGVWASTVQKGSIQTMFLKVR